MPLDYGYAAVTPSRVAIGPWGASLLRWFDVDSKALVAEQSAPGWQLFVQALELDGQEYAIGKNHDAPQGNVTIFRRPDLLAGVDANGNPLVGKAGARSLDLGPHTAQQPAMAPGIQPSTIVVGRVIFASVNVDVVDVWSWKVRRTVVVPLETTSAEGLAWIRHVSCTVDQQTGKITDVFDFERVEDAFAVIGPVTARFLTPPGESDGWELGQDSRMGALVVIDSIAGKVGTVELGDCFEPRRAGSAYCFRSEKPAPAMHCGRLPTVFPSLAPLPMPDVNAVVPVPATAIGIAIAFAGAKVARWCNAVIPVRSTPDAAVAVLDNSGPEPTTPPTRYVDPNAIATLVTDTPNPAETIEQAAARVLADRAFAGAQLLMPDGRPYPLADSILAARRPQGAFAFQCAVGNGWEAESARLAGKGLPLIPCLRLDLGRQDQVAQLIVDVSVIGARDGWKGFVIFAIGRPRLDLTPYTPYLDRLTMNLPRATDGSCLPGRWPVANGGSVLKAPSVVVDNFTLTNLRDGQEFKFHDDANPDLGLVVRVWVEGGSIYAAIQHAGGFARTGKFRPVTPS